MSNEQFSMTGYDHEAVVVSGASPPFFQPIQGAKARCLQIIFTFYSEEASTWRNSGSSEGRSS
jgi:hypothetical protein